MREVVVVAGDLGRRARVLELLQHANSQEYLQDLLLKVMYGIGWKKDVLLK